MRVTSKGQVTIPQAIREQAGLHPNCEVHFRLVGGQVVLEKVEVAFSYDQIEVVDAVLPRHLYVYWPIPREAAFLAARAHADYRARGASERRSCPIF